MTLPWQFDADFQCFFTLTTIENDQDIGLLPVILDMLT